jgi:hypothetical protein
VKLTHQLGLKKELFMIFTEVYFYSMSLQATRLNEQGGSVPTTPLAT